MRPSNFLNITLSVILLLAFVGIPVTKEYCTMEFCLKECKAKCCTEDTQSNSCQESVDYLQIDSDFSYTDASIRIPDINFFYVTYIHFFEKTVAMLMEQHGEFSYKEPLITLDIPVQVRCFRI